MFFVTVSRMSANYMRCPPIAVDDYRILVAAIWQCLETVVPQKPLKKPRRKQALSYHESVPSLAVACQKAAERGEPSGNADDQPHINLDLDFRTFVEMSPVDAIRRFRDAIEYCCCGKDAELFSRVGLSDLDQLFERMVNRTVNDDRALRESIWAVERNLERFATGVEIEQYKALDDQGGKTTAVTPLGATTENESDREGAGEFQQESNSKASPCRSRSVSRNAKGSQTMKLVAYLAQHHEYENSHVGNYVPADSAAIARESKVKANTVSDFLKREFKSTGSPRAGYVLACKNQATLLHWFMVQYKDSLPDRTGNIDTLNEKDVRERF